MSDPIVITLDGPEVVTARVVAGPPGPSIQLRVTATHVQWKASTSSTWTDLVAVADLVPDLGMGTVTTLAPGAAATASLTEVSPGVYEVALGIPRGATGTQGIQGEQGEPGVGQVTYSMGPMVVPRPGAYAWPVQQASVITGVSAVVTTLPVAGPVTVDVLVNGASVFTEVGHRPSIVPGGPTLVTVPVDVPGLAVGDLLTVDVVEADGSARCLVVAVAVAAA